MANPELVKALDYILNRCDDAEIDIVSAAVIRRKRDLHLFAQSGMPDPNKWAKDTAEALGTGSCGMGIDSVQKMVRNMVTEMLHKEAPELADEDIETLLASWMPGKKDEGKALPADALLEMVEQFVSFSHGCMSEEEDAALRTQFGSWPERYWQSFPPVVCQVVTDYLEGRSDERDFRAQLLAAVDMSSAKTAPKEESAEASTADADEAADRPSKAEAYPSKAGAEGMVDSLKKRPGRPKKS